MVVKRPLMSMISNLCGVERTLGTLRTSSPNGMKKIIYKTNKHHFKSQLVSHLFFNL